MNMREEKRTAAILAGGMAKRAGGNEKYFLPFRGKRIIDHILASLKPCCDEIIIVARDEAQCERFSSLSGIRCATDIRKGRGPIGGIHAAANSAEGELLLITACDMPCISTKVIDFLFEKIDDYDAIIPVRENGYLEPLHAVYRKSALIKRLENCSEGSLRSLINGMNTYLLPVDELKPFDAELRSFTNINDLEELSTIENSNGGRIW